MRNKFFILLFWISSFGFSQNNVLFENTWILKNLVINNEILFLPPNDEVSFVYQIFDFFSINNDDYYSTNGFICESIGGSISFSLDSDSFSFDELYETLGGGCNDIENSIFEGIYFGFFYGNFENGNVFNYSIINNSDNSKTLIITSLNGDQAVYGSETLSTQENDDAKFEIVYDNSRSRITINPANYLNNILVNIFNSHGKLIYKHKINTAQKTEIDIDSFSDGLYFILLTNNREISTSQKIIKY